MPKKFDSFYTPVAEKDEHKKSKEYKRLSPKMRNAVDDIFKKMDVRELSLEIMKMSQLTTIGVIV